MNDRIKELAEQSGMIQILDEHASEYGSVMFENTQYPELEKFAELIVQECAEVVQEGRWMVPPSQEQLARSIKQHFGVEK